MEMVTGLKLADSIFNVVDAAQVYPLQSQRPPPVRVSPGLGTLPNLVKAPIIHAPNGDPRVGLARPDCAGQPPFVNAAEDRARVAGE
jgi:hypothetical protein